MAIYMRARRRILKQCTLLHCENYAFCVAVLIEVSFKVSHFYVKGANPSVAACGK